MTRYSHFTSQAPINHEQIIFDHWLECVRSEAPAQLLRRFQSLFIAGKSYPAPYIQDHLDCLLAGSTNIETLLPFLNRCCYILVNRWQMNPAEKSAIVELASILGQVQSPGTARRHDRLRLRLRTLVYQYTQSLYFRQLRRVAEFVRDKGRVSKQAPLISLIDRYPYLYSHCLKTNDESNTRIKLLRHVQHEAQQKFETDLSRYIALSALKTSRSPVNRDVAVQNPTLLSSKDLHISLKHYVGRSTRQGTYRDMSRGFKRTVDPNLRFQNFKDNLFDYLTADINPDYANRKFNYNLRQHLNSISPEHNLQPVTKILMTRTYNRTLNHLVIESRQAPKHFVFMDLISNIGTTRTVGLLLKLVLLQDSVKDSLERRLGLLFQHYESHQQTGIRWLVRCFEKVNLAFTTHFGNLNVSYLATL